MALAAVQLGVSDEALARLGGRDGAAARALVATLRGRGGVEKLAAMQRELAAPRPAGWREIHESWVEAADRVPRASGEAASRGVEPGGAPRLAAETRLARGSRGDAVQRYLWRVAYGERVPMLSPSNAAASGGAVALVALEPGALTRALAILGRRQLAHALVGGAARSIAEMAARLPWGKELLADVASITGLREAAEGRLGARAVARVRCSGLTWSDPLSLPRAGTRAIAPAVSSVADLAEQLAQRLPRPVGAVLLAELRGFAVDASGRRDGASDAEIAAAIGRVTVADR